jgi:hypothetical protein
MSDLIARADLQPADVLLYRGKSILGKLIRLFDGTEVNHAGIYLGADTVGEAVARGVVRRPLQESIGDHPLVLARRLKAGPPTLKPVLDCADGYLQKGERYAYEQLLLLAFLSLTRKLKVTSILSKLLRKVLDRAASALLAFTSGGRQPMICSEFVYRCYDEALQEHDDVYSLRVGEMSLEPPSAGVDIPFATGVSATSSARRGRGVHPHSLLAWTIAHQRWAEPAFASPAPPEKVTDEELDTLTGQYLKEAGQAGTPPAFAAGDDPDLSAAVERFAFAFYGATKGVPTSAVSFTSSDPFQHLFRTAADFVTPGDLLRSESLFTLGEVK